MPDHGVVDTGPPTHPSSAGPVDRYNSGHPTVSLGSAPAQTPSEVNAMPSSPVTTTPPWMRSCLIAAGVYNLLWGALTVLRPMWLFDLASMDPPNYPFIWQCVGMIVGVYGIGYLAASSDPVRHWPIVLVGFLGKVFGPIGYVDGVLRGEVPPGFGITIPTNDLIWWVPFALMLAHAWRCHHSQSARGTERESPDTIGSPSEAAAR